MRVSGVAQRRDIRRHTEGEKLGGHRVWYARIHGDMNNLLIYTSCVVKQVWDDQDAIYKAELRSLVSRGPGFLRADQLVPIGSSAVTPDTGLVKRPAYNRITVNSLLF